LFEPIDADEGTDLCDYATPGQRCYTLWVAHERPHAQGRLQIDLAQAGLYDLAAISVEELELSTSATPPFRFLAYTPEMQLAAKLSWVMRGFNRSVGAERALPPQWSGAPKDLFDAHLLLTGAELRKDEFQKGLRAVGAEDHLGSHDIAFLYEASAGMRDEDFQNWEEFRLKHPMIVNRGPAELLRTVTDRLSQLLPGSLDHISFP
jgi:hypothetical protein